MPIDNYDPYYGGKPGSAGKAMLGMEQTYGKQKGDSVFYALVNKRKKKAGETKVK